MEPDNGEESEEATDGGGVSYFDRILFISHASRSVSHGFQIFVSGLLMCTFLSRTVDV